MNALEKHLSDLESRILDNSRHMMLPDREMFNRMRREMRDPGDASSLDEFFGGKGMMPSKPRLGVELAPISEDLKTRFKNEVKEGAFVLSVVVGSPAEKAGILMGDAITSFDGKNISHPRQLSDAVKTALAGSHDLGVVRHGELKALKVDLGEPKATTKDSAKLEKKSDNVMGGFWSGIGNDKNIKSSTDVHVSSLELTDALAVDLKLTDVQKKQMSAILDRHAKALSSDFVKDFASKPDELDFSINSQLNSLVQKHVDEAAKELSSVLDANQMKLWNDFRQAHSSASFMHTITIDNTPGARS